MQLICNNEKFNDELLLVVTLFYPVEEIENLNLNFNINYQLNNDQLSYTISITGDYT